MFYKIDDVSKRYQISKSAIKNYIKNGVLPQPKRIGRNIRWSSEQLEQFELSL